MSSLMSSHGMALATAMTLSSTVILVSLCRQKPFSIALQFDHRYCDLRPCFTSVAEKRKRTSNQNKMKRVRFGEDIIVEFDDCIDNDGSSNDSEENAEIEIVKSVRRRDQSKEVPANQVALYNGILQDRLQRMACY